MPRVLQTLWVRTLRGKQEEMKYSYKGKEEEKM
jgi:hypothetical protein